MFTRISGAIVAAVGISWALSDPSNMALVLGAFMTAIGAAAAVFGGE